MIDRLIQLYAHAPEHPAKLRLFAWLYRLLKGRRRVEVYRDRCLRRESGHCVVGSPAKRVETVVGWSHVERAALDEAEQHVEQRVAQRCLARQCKLGIEEVGAEDAQARSDDLHRRVGIGPRTEKDRRCCVAMRSRHSPAPPVCVASSVHDAHIGQTIPRAPGQFIYAR